MIYSVAGSAELRRALASALRNTMGPFLTGGAPGQESAGIAIRTEVKGLGVVMLEPFQVSEEGEGHIGVYCHQIEGAVAAPTAEPVADASNAKRAVPTQAPSPFDVIEKLLLGLNLIGKTEATIISRAIYRALIDNGWAIVSLNQEGPSATTNASSVAGEARASTTMAPNRDGCAEGGGGTPTPVEPSQAYKIRSATIRLEHVIELLEEAATHVADARKKRPPEIEELLRRPLGELLGGKLFRDYGDIRPGSNTPDPEMAATRRPKFW